MYLIPLLVGVKKAQLNFCIIRDNATSVLSLAAILRLLNEAQETTVRPIGALGIVRDNTNMAKAPRFKKPGFFLKAQPSGFYWVLLGFWTSRKK